ncbi:MAG: DUF4139 domain-containing protein [bacterium]|nr:DUF4139 domain-containing protein [bacterium]
MRRAFFIGLMTALLAVSAVAAQAGPSKPSGEGIELTVYNKNLGLVTERRFMDLKGGVSEIRYEGVAGMIDPTSLQFYSLVSPGECRILEQSYQYDLVSDQALLQRYLDKQITVITEDSTLYEGRLLNSGMSRLPGGGSIILMTGDGRIVNIRLDKVREIRYPSLPEGLITRPTMVWKLDNASPGRQLTEVRYLTGGIDWKSDYVATLSADEKTIDLTGWVTLNNRSGGTYRDARLKLMAGDLNMVTPAPVPVMEAAYARKAMLSDASGEQFEEQSFFEYHLYTLQRPTSILDNEVKQIELLSAARVPVNKLYYYDGARRRYSPPGYRGYIPAGVENKKINTVIEMVNSAKNNLGMPLPAGKIRLNKGDADGSLQFIGEDVLGHTPKDEVVRLYMGDAFDIVGERVQTDTRKIADRVIEESYRIKIRNRKSEDITVRTVEHLDRYNDWEIVRTTAHYEKKDAGTVEFPLSVPAGKETVLEYTVRYKW